MTTNAMTKDIDYGPQKEVAALVPVTPMDMLNRAVSSGASLDMVEKLMTLQDRWEKGLARKAFDNAMADAKAEIPNITKNREVDFTSQKGRTHYRYEDLGEIARVVSPILAKHGLSYRYRTTSNINEPVSVTCIVSHREGHFEENTLCAGKDDTGGKNLIQQVGSTLTYLQRMTLKAALGLAVSNDDDGKAAGPSVECVTQAQADYLRDLIEANGKDRAAFLKWAKVEQIEQIAAAAYDSCIKAIEFKAPAK